MPKIPTDLAERFRRVCPMWAMHILDGYHTSFGYPSPGFLTSDGRWWRIDNAYSCIVGEAYGRRHSYDTNVNESGCPECTAFATCLMKQPNDNWLTFLKEFLDHYEAKHAVEVPA